MLTKNDLLVLGLLVERPMHGYEIGQVLKTQGIETWFEISTAAVYYSLNKLSRGAAIAETRARSNSGDKTIYHVTEKGREEFLSEIARLLASQELNRTDYYLGVLLLNRLPQDDAAAYLKRRAGFLRQWGADLGQWIATADVHPLQRAVLHHSMAVAALDADWLSGLAEQMQSGQECDPVFGDLMTFQGDLEDFHLPDLFRLIVSGKHSGTLTVSAGIHTRTVTVHEGKLKCAASQVSGKPITDPERVLADVYQLFGWQQGAYVFNQRACLQEGCVPLNMSFDMLILEGARRLDSWDVIQRSVPTSEVLFEPQAVALQAGLALTLEEAQVLDLLDGARDTATIARLSDLTEFETGKILYALYLVGLIRPSDPDRSHLRRVFREFAELMCRGAIPYRTTSEEASACEAEVNQRCADLPVRVHQSRIVDETDDNLSSTELAAIYRRFLRTQHAVLSERLGREVADDLRRQVLARISPVLREVLEQYALL